MFRPRKIPSVAVWLLTGLTLGTVAHVDVAIAQASSKPKVVATNAILCDLAKQIAKNSVELTCLMEPGQDPHLYEMRPADRRAIEQAKLVLYGGYRYAPAIEKAIKAANNGSTKVAVYEIATPKPRKSSGHHHHGEEKGKGHDHDHDHDHSKEKKAEPKVADAHIWHNVKNTRAMLKVLRRNLIKIQPKSTFQYIDRTKALNDELKRLDEWIQAQVKTVPDDKRVLITSHDAMGYYADAYGFKVQSALGAISTEERPSAKQVKLVVDAVRKSGVKTVFAETAYKTRLIEIMAREADVKVAEKRLFVEGLGQPESGADTYQKMMRHNTCVIVTGLGGKCQS
ncbi:zinc ABC transporter substrate-binding protein [filamentous cyanobacterium LEGE 11480]|uniref:Zinc ABC transporter substrate-binding protein n=1 Tax=Romeriopsis navalis LEGE 11480 TaxID=2777977 RepID=A0A928VMZ2_9CYAN|nr:zinc ABC transporter substrate-binding protein [Romeriopsis navalis]MBE9028934.1 zinc ABC transporter substrate-binding protein [Romeriopsis navalis LEGE 11480]